MEKRTKKAAVMSAITLLSVGVLSPLPELIAKGQIVAHAEEPPADEDVPSGPEMKMFKDTRALIKSAREMMAEGEEGLEFAKEDFEKIPLAALKNIKNIEVKAPGLLAEVEKLRQELYGTTPAPQPDPKPQPTPPGPVETTEEIVVIESIAPGEKRVANPDMEEGKETRTPGKDGEALVTYKVYKKDGVEYKREAISQTVKTAPVDTIIEYGTKKAPVVVVSEVKVEEPVPFTSREVDNPNLEKGQRKVVTPGKDGVKTVTYSVRTVDGKETERNKVSEEITTPAVEEVIEVGTKEVTVIPGTPIVVPVVKDETKTEVIPFEKQTRENSELAKGETRVVQEGKDGVRTIVYTVTTVDGQETGRVVKSDTTTPAVPEITEIGTKEVTVIPGTPIVVPVVKDETKSEVIPFEKQTRENPELAKGETRVVQEGKDGVRTIVYTVTTVDGQETGRVVKSDTTTPAVAEITEVGTKDIPVTPAPSKPVVKTETKHESIPFEKQTRKNPELAKGETRVVQEGKDGIRTIVYTVTMVDGKEVSRVIKAEGTTPAVPEIIEIGTKGVSGTTTKKTDTKPEAKSSVAGAKAEAKAVLPKTGEQKSLLAVIGAAVLAVLGGLMWFRKRKE